ncbi:unnamed protein product [Dovyalis caffra]|uniref:Uncharacterized protein n=1 Tax=Dovyalis caffra TaxID=77055 RepID=A0AAV1QUT0_9ROSI|nr:unnamed protein product [Dovyalis caffra]
MEKFEELKIGGRIVEDLEQAFTAFKAGLRVTKVLKRIFCILGFDERDETREEFDNSLEFETYKADDLANDDNEDTSPLFIVRRIPALLR